MKSSVVVFGDRDNRALPSHLKTASREIVAHLSSGRPRYRLCNRTKDFLAAVAAQPHEVVGTLLNILARDVEDELAVTAAEIVAVLGVDEAVREVYELRTRLINARPRRADFVDRLENAIQALTLIKPIPIAQRDTRSTTDGYELWSQLRPAVWRRRSTTNLSVKPLEATIVEKVSLVAPGLSDEDLAQCLLHIAGRRGDLVDALAGVAADRRLGALETPIANLARSSRLYRLTDKQRTRIDMAWRELAHENGKTAAIYVLVDSLGWPFYVGETERVDLNVRFKEHQENAKKQVERPVYAKIRDLAASGLTYSMVILDRVEDQCVFNAESFYIQVLNRWQRQVRPGKVFELANCEVLRDRFAPTEGFTAKAVPTDVLCAAANLSIADAHLTWERARSGFLRARTLGPRPAPAAGGLEI